MKYYFRSFYKFCYYSKNWYGCYDKAPKAEIIFYDDNNCFCIGYVEDLDSINILKEYDTISVYDTEEEALEKIEELSVDVDGVYFGEKLENREFGG